MTQHNKQPAKFRHLGLYRSVLTSSGSRPISLREASIDNRVLKSIFQRGSCTSGDLHRRLGGNNQTLDEIQGSLTRLESWEMVELRPGLRANSLFVTLTYNGKYWASELVSKDQLDERERAENMHRENSHKE